MILFVKRSIPNEKAATSGALNGDNTATKIDSLTPRPLIDIGNCLTTRIMLLAQMITGIGKLMPTAIEEK